MPKIKNDARFSLRMPLKLKKRLQRNAIKVNAKCNDLIIELLETYLD